MSTSNGLILRKIQLIAHNYKSRKRQVYCLTAANNSKALFRQNKAVLGFQFSQSTISRYRHMLIIGSSQLPRRIRLLDYWLTLIKKSHSPTSSVSSVNTTSAGLLLAGTGKRCSAKEQSSFLACLKGERQTGGTSTTKLSPLSEIIRFCTYLLPKRILPSTQYQQLSRPICYHCVTGGICKWGKQIFKCRSKEISAHELLLDTISQHIIVLTLNLHRPGYTPHSHRK